MKIVFLTFFPCVALMGLCALYSANRSLYVRAELFRMTKYGSLAVSHQTREDVMKNLFQTEYHIAAVYSLAALHAGG